jgi:uncharacterized Zn-finger protein
MALETPTTAPDPDADVVIVSSKYVKCDGGGGPLGHPVSWMDMGDDDFVVCKYCDKVFKLDPNATGGAH